MSSEPQAGSLSPPHPTRFWKILSDFVPVILLINLAISWPKTALAICAILLPLFLIGKWLKAAPFNSERLTHYWKTLSSSVILLWFLIYAPIAVAVGFAVVLPFVLFELWKSSRHIRRLKQAGLYPAKGEPITDDQIKELIRRNERIPAMKLYRMRTNVGLTEAKAAVEKLAAERSLG